MNQAENIIEKENLRKVLGRHIVDREKQPDALLEHFLEADSVTSEQALEVDRSIIKYLEAHSPRLFSKGARFILPVSKKFGEEGVGEPLIHPDGSHMKGGPSWGIKFYNGKDKVWQAAVGDASRTIVIGGEITPRKAEALQAKLVEVTNGTGNPEDLNIESFKALLTYAAEELDLNDIWNSRLSNIAYKSQRVDGRAIDPAGTGDLIDYTGYFENRPERQEGVVAVHVKGPALFFGDVAGGTQDYSEAKGFCVTMGVRNGESQYRGVEEEPFLRDYVNSAGDNLRPNDFITMDATSLHVLLPQKQASSGRSLGDYTPPAPRQGGWAGAV